MDHKGRFSKIILIGLAFLFGAGVVLFCQADIWKDRFCVQDDVMQYLLPFSRGKDIALDADDLISHYSLLWNTPGSRWLYQTTAGLVDPLLVTKLLPILLCGLTSMFVYLLANYVWSPSCGFFASVLVVLYAWNIHAFSGGLPRSFAFPLLAAFLYFMVAYKNISVLVVTFLGAIFYPQTALLMVTISVGWIVLRWARQRKLGAMRKVVFVGLVMVVAVGLMCWVVVHLPSNNFLGRVYSFEEMKMMPEFGRAGRCPFFVDWQFFVSDVVAAERLWGLNMFCPSGFLLISLGIAGCYVAFRRLIKYHAIVGLTLGASFLWYVFSWPIMLHVFLPGRFLKFAVPLCLAVMGAAAIERFTYLNDFRWRLGFRVVLLVMICCWTFPTLKKDFVCYPKPELYEFLSSLSSGVMIAGHPQEMDEITVFSGKKVFITKELSLPFYRTYFQRISGRTYDFFSLYYATDWASVKRICMENSIRYIVVKEEHFTREYFDGQFLKREGGGYFEPFGQYVQHLVAGHRIEDFVFSRVPDQAKIYSNRGYFVVDVSRLLWN